MRLFGRLNQVVPVAAFYKLSHAVPVMTVLGGPGPKPTLLFLLQLPRRPGAT